MLMEENKFDQSRLDAIIKRHAENRSTLIPLLQEVQEEFGYIPPESMETIAEGMNLFPSQVQGVVNFYAGFSLKPKGKYVIRVCRGTACHVKGGRSILRLLQKNLDLEENETTADYQFTLETVACLGACFLAPAMMVNKTYYGRLSPQKITSILAHYDKEKGEG